MKRFGMAVIAAFALAAGAMTAMAEETPAAPAAAAEAMSTDATPIGDLLDNPQAHAILERHLPSVVSSDQIDMARGMTLKAIQPYAPDDITDEKLSAIDAELAALSH